MKNLTYALLLFFTLSLTFAACSQSSVNDKIDAAYAAYGDKDMASAQQQLRLMLDNDSTDSYSCNDLCRLSILLMKLSEQGYEENIAQAVHCYYRSFEVNADSATAYYAALPVEDAPYVTILSALSMSLDPSQENRLQEFEVNENDIDLLMNNSTGDEH
ncbi:MAG: hypothetical protein K2O00_02600 [Muribaculaceae bacterium]|nr:hypothetical protein [Muribaculaceae bacterium]